MKKSNILYVKFYISYSICVFIHRFYFGKNKVMAYALGRTAEEEYRENLHKISRRLYGQRGLLFTNKSQEEVVK